MHLQLRIQTPFFQEWCPEGTGCVNACHCKPSSASSLFDKEQQRALDLILKSLTPKLPNFKFPL